MTTLYVDTTARFQNLATSNLASRILIQYGEPVIYRPISETTAQAARIWPGAYFTKPDDRSSEQLEALETSQSLAAEFFAADNFVINIPLAGGTIPYSFLGWIDLISYSDQDIPEGFQDKSATLVVASGGLKAGSERDDLTPQLTHLLNAIGITNVTIVAADQFTPPAKGTQQTALAA